MKKQCIESFIYSDRPENLVSEYYTKRLYKLIYLKQGEITVSIARKRYECTSPCLIFISDLEPHTIEIKSKIYERYILSLHPERISSDIYPKVLSSIFFCQRANFCHILPLDQHTNSIDTLINDLYKENEQGDNDGVMIWLSALLHKIYRICPQKFSERSSQKEHIVDSVCRKLADRSAVTLDLDDLATEHYISRYYLSHIFSEVTGYSIKGYLMICRIAHACELLCGDRISVNQVANLSGFADISNFSRYFKEYIGMTPTEYKKIKALK